MSRNERRDADDDPVSIRGLSAALGEDFEEDPREIERQAREFDIEPPDEAAVERDD